MQKPVKLEQDGFKRVMLHVFSETGSSAACSTNPTCSPSHGTNHWGHSLMGGKGFQHLTLCYSILKLAEIQSPPHLALRDRQTKLPPVISDRVKEIADWSTLRGGGWHSLVSCGRWKCVGKHNALQFNTSLLTTALSSAFKGLPSPSRICSVLI